MSGRRWIITGLALLLAFSLTLGAASAAPAAQQCGSNYVVRYGDDLYQISLRSGVSMDAIARANNIYNYNVVYAGQTLFIPCGYNYQPQYVAPQPYQPQYMPQPQYQPYYAQQYNPNPNHHHLYNGSAPNYTNVWVPPTNGYVPPAYYPQYPQQPQGQPGYCGGIVGTSPLGGLAHGGNTFYWNPTYGVTNYRVRIFGVDVNPGALLATFNTAGTETSVSGDVGGLPGYQLAWDVQGLSNGAVVCTSQRYTMGHAVR